MFVYTEPLQVDIFPLYPSSGGPMCHKLLCLMLACSVVLAAKSSIFAQNSTLTPCLNGKCAFHAKNDTNATEATAERENERDLSSSSEQPQARFRARFIQRRLRRLDMRLARIQGHA